jgi:two-component system, OmpR family, response regulator
MIERLRHQTAVEAAITDHGHLLVVDDDPQIRLLVSRLLQRNGYRVSLAQDGRVMAEIMAKVDIDLVLLDVMLPGRSGLDLCRDIRAKSNIPIIMLTARGDEGDRVAGLEIGADDYVTKPFSSRELLARVRAALRRVRAPSNDRTLRQAADEITFDDWSLNLRRRELQSPEGVFIDLSTGEYDLLVAFVEHANRVLSRDQLMELAKAKSSDPFDRTIDVQVSRLRRKLVVRDGDPEMIKTVRGAGYMFTPRVLSSGN